MPENKDFDFKINQTTVKAELYENEADKELESKNNTYDETCNKIDIKNEIIQETYDIKNKKNAE